MHVYAQGMHVYVCYEYAYACMKHAHAYTPRNINPENIE